MEELKYAYAAGLMDGEGSFMVGKTVDQRYNDYVHYSVSASVNITDPDIVDWLKQEFGGKVRHRSARTSTREEQFQWTLREREELINFCQKLLPYLKIKQLQAKIVLEFCSKFPLRSALTVDVKTEMENYYEIAKTANARGPGTMEVKKKLLALLT